MKKKKFISILLGFIFLFNILQSCDTLFGDDDEGENETKISSYNSDESHNAGQNCMNCHKQGGDGEGWFTVAGTVYDSLLTDVYSNVTIRLYAVSSSLQNPIAVIEADKKGNFYTTEDIDFEEGLLVTIEANNNTAKMFTPVKNGQCNSCHGVSVDRIWIK